MTDQTATAPGAPAAPAKAPQSAPLWLAAGLRGTGHRLMPAGEATRIGQAMARHGLHLPSGLRAEFAQILLAGASPASRPLPADQLSGAFDREYMVREPGSALLLRCTAGRRRLRPADPWITLFDIRQSMCVTQDNPALVVAATLTALGLDVTILSRHSHRLEPGGLLIVYAECLAGCRAWGAGIGGDLTSALLKAALSSVCRAGLMRAPRQ